MLCATKSLHSWNNQLCTLEITNIRALTLLHFISYNFRPGVTPSPPLSLMSTASSTAPLARTGHATSTSLAATAIPEAVTPTHNPQDLPSLSLQPPESLGVTATPTVSSSRRPNRWTTWKIFISEYYWKFEIINNKKRGIYAIKSLKYEKNLKLIRI